MSRTTWWFARWIQEQDHHVHVVDPTRSRAMTAGLPKTDRCDARWLAAMGAKDVLHEVYVIKPETERLRELVRHRALWVRDQTRIKNRIHYQLAREQRRCPHRSVFAQKGLRWLEEQELLQPYAQSLGNHLTHFRVRAPRSRTSHRTAARCRDRYADFNVATVDPRHRGSDGTNAAGRDRNHSPIPASREVD